MGDPKGEAEARRMGEAGMGCPRRDAREADRLGAGGGVWCGAGVGDKAGEEEDMHPALN